MRNRLWSLCILTCMIGLIAGAISGAPFDPEFKVVKIAGECTIKAPGAGDFAAAEEGKSYPYGSDLWKAHYGSRKNRVEGRNAQIMRLGLKRVWSYGLSGATADLTFADLLINLRTLGRLLQEAPLPVN